MRDENCTLLLHDICRLHVHTYQFCQSDHQSQSYQQWWASSSRYFLSTLHIITTSAVRNLVKSNNHPTHSKNLKCPFQYTSAIIQSLKNSSVLDDRINGCTYAAVLHLSSSSVCTECIMAKRCVLEQKLQLTAYRQSYMRNRLAPKWMILTFV